VRGLVKETPRRYKALQFSGAMHFSGQYDQPVHDGPRTSYQVEVRCTLDTVNTEKPCKALAVVPVYGVNILLPGRFGFFWCLAMQTVEQGLRILMTNEGGDSIANFE